MNPEELSITDAGRNVRVRGKSGTWFEGILIKNETAYKKYPVALKMEHGLSPILPGDRLYFV